ncbi:50S ribosomal protein L13, chloroplastic [Vitis vinifera]|uniref:50S ribosomal protein L13, chloroplastic n=1 Tax=Vitis vinifera TaxID=29760 RepID=A0A438FGT9_VITVI|nr:50S ribosomal protein L13, chloroplastic [Vitis vinifera]
MAITFASSSVMLPSPSPKPSFGQSFRVNCQDKAAVVPLDQRWMFEQSEVSGPDIWNKTWYPKAADHINTEKTWYIVDATDKILGRLASTIAIYIRGKNLATYTPSVDMGSFCNCGTHYKHLAYCRVFYSGHWHRQNPKRFVVLEPKKVNAEKVAVSGKKRTQKLYRRHSGRPGGMKVETFDQLQQRIPERIVEHAVRGMLPKGRVSSEVNKTEVILQRTILTASNLAVHFSTILRYNKGPHHPHEAQKPIDLPIRDKRIQKER